MTEHIRIGDIRPRIQYVGNGAVKAFAFPFPVFAASDLAVYLDDAAQADGFTVAGVGQSGGGCVSFVAAPAAGTVVTLSRAVPIARTTDFQEGGVFRANVINEELDRLVCMVQQLSEDISRTLKRPPTSTSEASLDLPEPMPGRGLKFAPDGALTLTSCDPDAAQIAAASDAALAAAARSAAEVARDQVFALYDSFDDRYLGVHGTDPSADHDGNPLFGGALYFNEVEGAMKVYDGAAWVAAYVSGSGFLLGSNALAELASRAATARANIGAAAAADLAATQAQLLRTQRASRLFLNSFNR
jgi:hypothetical protein